MDNVVKFVNKKKRNIKVKKPPSNKNNRITTFILGWIFLGISLFLLPILIGAASICINLIKYYDGTHSFQVIFMFISAALLTLISFFSFIITIILFMKASKGRT